MCNTLDLHQCPHIEPSYPRPCAVFFNFFIKKAPNNLRNCQKLALRPILLNVRDNYCSKCFLSLRDVVEVNNLDIV